MSAPGSKPSEKEDARARFYCPTCGMVRCSDVAPWCRHYDPERAMAATRMRPLPSWHPIAKAGHLA